MKLRLNKTLRAAVMGAMLLGGTATAANDLSALNNTTNLLLEYGVAYDTVTLMDYGAVTMHYPLAEEDVRYDMRYRTSIEQLKVSGYGGYVVGVAADAYYGQGAMGSSAFTGEIQVDSLSGSGLMTFVGCGTYGVNIFTVSDVHDFSGNIIIENQSLACSRYTTTFNMAVLQLESCEMAGFIGMQPADTRTNQDRNRIAFGVAGDLTIGGLNSADGSTRVYSGRLLESDYAHEIHVDIPFENFYEEEAHTLTINADKTLQHTFRGKVYGSLSIVMQGLGRQNFTGDMSDFDGSITVNSGSLYIEESVRPASVAVYTGDFGVGGMLSTSGALNMRDGFILANGVTAKAGSFSGCNEIETSALTGTTWTLNLTPENEKSAVVTVDNTARTGRITLDGFELVYDAAQMYNGEYKLFTYEGTLNIVLDKLAFSLDGEALTLGEQGESQLYLADSVVNGVHWYTLMLSVTDGGLVRPRDKATTLTWVADDGVWAVDYGHFEHCWSGSANNLNFLNGDSVVFSQAADVRLRGKVEPASVKINLSSGTLRFLAEDATACLAGKTALAIDAPGAAVEIHTANTFTGGTQMSAGALSLRHAQALGSGKVVLSGVSLDFNALAVANAVQVKGDVELLDGASYAGALELVSGSLSGDALNVAGDMQVKSGSISNALVGSGRVVKSGSGSVLLSGESSYSGGTRVSGGTLQLGSAQALGSGEVSLTSGTLDAADHAFANALTVEGTVSLHAAEYAGELTLKSGRINGSVLHLAQNATLQSGTVALQLSGTAGVVKSGSGSVTLSAANSYAGDTLVQAGTLTLGHATAAGSGALLLQGGTLSLGGKAVANALLVQGAATVKGGSAYTGALTLQSGSLKGETLQLLAAATLHEGSVANVLKGSGAVQKLGAGTVTLTAANSYSGGTLVQGGTLVAGHASAFGSGEIALGAACLDLNAKAVANSLRVTGEAQLLNAGSYKGSLVLDGGALSGSAVQLSKDASLLSGSVENVLSGSAAVVKQGAGAVLLSAANSYSGGTQVQGGTLVAGHAAAFGTGELRLEGGVLDFAGLQVANDVRVAADATLLGASAFSGSIELQGGTLTAGELTLSAASSSLVFNGGALQGNVTLQSGELVVQSAASLSGDLQLQGGNVVFSSSASGTQLSVAQQVVLAEDTVFIFDARPEEKLYTLLSFDAWSGSLENLTLTTRYHSPIEYEFVLDEHSLSVRVLDSSAVLYWNASKGTWAEGAISAWGQEDGSAADSGFCAGDFVIINRSATLTIEGEVAPSAVLVEADKSVTFKTSYNKKTGEFSGSLTGSAVLTKRGKGTLTLNDGNEYTGGTFIEAGTVKAAGVASFGSGAITLSGGAVDLASKEVANDIVLEGSAAVKGGKKYAGVFTMNGGELLKGSVVNVAEVATLKSGMLNGSLSGEGTVVVSGEVMLGTTGKITANALDVQGSLSVSSKGLAMNSKASAITLNGGTLSSEGKISAFSMNMTGGTLDVTNAKPMGITLNDAFVATDGADIDLYGALTANQLTLAGVDFTLAMDEADIAPKVQPKAQSITLKGKGLLNTISDSELDIAGKVSVTGDLALADSTLSLHDVAGAAKPKAQGLTVKGALAVEDSALSTTGSVSAAALTATGSVISIAAQEGLAAQSLKLTRKDVTKGVPQDNVLTDSALYVNGSMSVAGNLDMQGSFISLRDYSGKKKAMGMSVKGDLTVGSGSVLSLTGALSAKNLTLEGGSSLMLASAKLSTVKVGGALTLNGVVDVDLGFTVTEKDVAKGKAYTLFSFKSLVGDISNLTLGYEGEYTLALNAKGTAITLTVDDAAAWNAYVADIQESLDAAPAVADAVDSPEEEVEAEELLLKPVAAAADVDPLLAKVADTLVQSTWGTVGASRAFGETIAGRGRNATLLGEEGKGAAWLSVMGGSSHISSAEGHNGADFTLSGAAFGVEGRVGEKSTLGVAIGNSWGKVSTFSAFPVDQDSMHVGIYGNHTLTKSLTLSWMATHTRTESEATILGAPYSWSQDALLLDARLTWGKNISEKTAVSAFAGLQYLATDSGECAGLKTGSLQNLRAELGVGASHKLDENTLVFGELSFIGDMVRNNPTAAIGDYRTHGTNPGRVGLNLSVGAQHQLSEDWSLNASYSLELMENCTGHSLNVGASYSF